MVRIIRQLHIQRNLSIFFLLGKVDMVVAGAGTGEFVAK
jgi:hypothetical protein